MESHKNHVPNPQPVTKSNGFTYGGFLSHRATPIRFIGWPWLSIETYSDLGTPIKKPHAKIYWYTVSIKIVFHLKIEMILIEIEWTWQIKRQTILHTYLKYLEPPYDKQNWLDLSSGSHHALKNPAHWLLSHPAVNSWILNNIIYIILYIHTDIYISYTYIYTYDIYWYMAELYFTNLKLAEIRSQLHTQFPPQASPQEGSHGFE